MPDARAASGGALRQAGSAPGETFPSARYAWFVVCVLMLANTLSFVDRMLLTLLVGPIRESFAISDLQLSLLHGIAFALFFTVLGLPIARIADRGSRVRILTAGVVAFSAMTALCGLARSFGTMFAARAGVGGGSAAVAPAAFSMITDCFPPEDRSRPIGAFTATVFLGSGLAMVAGAGLVALAPSLDLPLLRDLDPWRRVFVLVATPGAAVALVVASLREPVRRERLPGEGAEIPIARAARYVWERRRAYGAVIGGDALRSTLHNGVLAWLPTLFIRSFEASPADAGLRVGVVLAIAGSLGSYAGGALSKRLRERGHPDADPRVAILGGAARLVGVAAPLMPTASSALAAYAVFLFASGVTTGVAVAAVQAITPNQLRAQVGALFLFAINLAGLGLGASLVAAFTDLVFRDDSALRYSLSLAAAITTPVGVLWMWRGLAAYRAALAGLRF